ncbi:MAG: restriction endonuclease [Candidatus Doudnabacteria bacterium]|nr:restriction endonuclease [Candidatus Doudnabacteria bacterium]
MKRFDIKTVLEEEINKIGLGWDIKGVIDSQKRIYTINNDTKLISKVFELVTTPIVLDIAEKNKLKLVESDRQTVYPDFTFIMSDKTKIALDIKSTYRRNGDRVAGFTLGSYTAYLRNPTKNIMFPYHEYKEHWILGFIYSRAANVKADIVPITKLDDIVPVIKDIEIIVQPKYKIASERPGSGNTANIGSISEIKKLQEGEGPFAKYGEEVFEDYWRNFMQRKTARDGGKEQPFRKIEEYLKWKKRRK